MSRHVVDLTLDSDSDSEERAWKRRRCQSAGGRSAAASTDYDDGDVVVVEPARERPRPRPSAEDMDLGDEDVVITGGIGQVATRDLAHPRPDCAEHRFTSSTSTSNAAFCPQCFCFVCDVKASECQYWGTGARERDHANSRQLGYWKRLREAARAPGSSGLINSEYRASGPIGNFPQPKPQLQSRLPFPAAATGQQWFPRPVSAAGADASGQAGGVAAAGQQAHLATSGQSNAVPTTGQSSAVAGRAASNQPTTMIVGSTALLNPALPTVAPAARNPAPTAAAVVAPAALNPAPTAAAVVAPAARNPAPTVAATTAAAQVAARVARTTPSACKLRPLPDPSSDRHAFELGVLQFSVKAVRGFTIAELAGRLQRFGFNYNIMTRQEDWADRLALDNLFDSRFGLFGGKYKSKSTYLKMLPLPPPPEEAHPVPTERVRKVLVVDCLGRARATYMGVRVPAKIKRADLLAALAPMLRPLFSASSELLHLVNFASSTGFDTNNIKPVEPDADLDDSFFSGFFSAGEGPQLVVYRTSHHPAPTWADSHAGGGPGAASAQPHPKWTAMPVYVHGGGGSPSSASSGTVPAWVVVQIRLFKPPPGPTASSAEREGPSTTRLSASLLVPLRKDHAKGGPEAQRVLNGALLRGLQPYRTPSALSPGHAAPAVILRNGQSHMISRPTHTSVSSWGVQGDVLGVSAPASSLRQLAAVFAHDLPATSFRLDEMRSPAVDASASSDIMRESEATITEARKREASCRKRKELPVACITELVSTSRRPQPDDKASIINLGTEDWGKVATDAVLLPSSRPGATPREGVLVIKVYTSTFKLQGRPSLFQPWDEWPSITRRDNVSRFPLRKTMELISTGAANPDEQALLAADAAAAAAAAGGPSTSSGSCAAGAAGGSSLLVAGSAELQRRVQAERRRARVMVASAKELDASAYRHRSINTLLEFMQSDERPAIAQPAGLTVELRPYQLQSVAFMLDLERLIDTPAAAGGGAGPSTSAGSAAAEVDPADGPDGGCPGGYRRLFWLPVTNPRGRRYWYSPVFERLTMEVPAQPIGGFLAEEMGLGKTVEVMALTLANPPAPSLVAGATLPCGRVASRATLVVCAVSLVGQWQAEAQNKTSGSCRIHPYHGQSRIRDPKRLASEFDVVVTTYQTLQSDHASGTKDTCQQIKWHRIVFDEGHTLRNAGAKLAKTALELKADRKWLCTGTPINNAVDDLLGQFAAIHLLPLGRKPYFDWHIKHPFQCMVHADSFNSAPLLYALRHTMIRHTKAQNLGGEGVLQLPNKTETDVPVFLSAQEQELYRKVHKEALHGWQKLKAAGTAYVNSHLFTATSMLMPLRRICSGGLMRPQDLAVPDPERLNGVAGANCAGGGAGAAATMTDNTEVPVPVDVSECPICVDNIEQPVVTRCNHWFCQECLSVWMNASAHHNCPACRQPITAASLRRGAVAPSPPAAQPAAQDSDDGDDSDEATSDGGVLCVSKLRVLLAELRAMREADPKAKALVFTQFGQTLEWLKPRLVEEGFGHRTITGDMTQKRRTEAIDSFQHDPKTSVFLLSVRSGAVGINLTAANYVFLLEPCMNPAMEEQAIGRAWRMGQQRPVVVKRFFAKGSVEERIREVVKSRRAASGGASVSDSDGNDGAGPSTAARMSIARGLVPGSLRQDKTDLRINELELMFREPEFPPPDAAGAGAGQL